MRDGRGLLDRLVSACLSLMVAAIAVSVAVTIVRPYLALLGVIGGVVLAVTVWRAWQRSRW